MLSFEMGNTFNVKRGGLLKKHADWQEENPSKKLKPGDYVKLIFGPTESNNYEGIWVEILTIKAAFMYGRIANSPALNIPVNFNDKVQFKYAHIAEFQSAEDFARDAIAQKVKKYN